MSLKLRGAFCVRKMKNDAKFEIELACNFKIDMRNGTEELCLIALKIDTNFEGKLACASKN